MNIRLSQAQLDQFDQYARILRQWNEKMNLTAITDPMEIVVKHFLDSLWLLRHLPVNQKTKFIDVGTGAGFPALPIAIAVPGLCPVLLDSLNKRLVFLQAVCEALHLKATFLHARAEDAGRRPETRQQFDIVTARAVAPLPQLCEYCMPFVKKGGLFAAMKGPDGKAELDNAGAAIRKLGGAVKDVFSYSLSDGSSRTLIVIERISPLSPVYPRPTAKIKKEPL